jgi:hypothetical protein
MVANAETFRNRFYWTVSDQDIKNGRRRLERLQILPGTLNPKYIEYMNEKKKISNLKKYSILEWLQKKLKIEKSSMPLPDFRFYISIPFYF